MATYSSLCDPCETCLRWPECNGVDADTCPQCTDQINPWQLEIAAQKIAAEVAGGIITPNEARRRMGLPEIQEE